MADELKLDSRELQLKTLFDEQEKKITDLEARCTELFLQNNEFAERLAKAKEIIRQFLNDYPVITKEILNKLDQFIKEIEND